ncbi:MAG: hypothetical protein H6702_20580 [Myxococcales bacterium]|nr:hypothetical protein [Myxococcales bacterium]
MGHPLPTLRIALPLLAVSVLCVGGPSACVDPVDPGAPRLIDGPRWSPPPAVDRPPTDPGTDPDGPVGFPDPDGPVVPPEVAPDGTPVLREPALPAPWDERALAVVARDVSRRVMASEAVVGLAALADDGLVALSAEGGLFRTDDWRPLRALSTPLPASGFTRLHGWGPRLLACRPAGAWASADGGQRWRSAGFGCGAGGRATVAVAGGRLYRLHGAELLRSTWPAGESLTRAVLPLDAPQAVAAFDQTVVVFGARSVARSLDGGQTFTRAVREDGDLLDVRAAVFLSKTRAVAVGDAPADAGLALLSEDGGARWRAVPLPRRAESLRDVAVTAVGSLVAVTDDRLALAFASEDGGERWQPLAPGAPVASAVVARRRGGVAAASPRGVTHTLGAAAVPQTLGLTQPLWAVAVSHPQVAVGAGVESGLFRTVDGGQTWAQVPGTLGVRFADVARVAGHRVVAVGDGLLWVTDDAGRAWVQAVPPASCEARWVRFSPAGLGVVACGGGTSLVSDDGGGTWRVGPALPATLGPPVWAHGRALAPRLDGPGVAVSDDGAGWHLEQAPAFVDLQAGGDGWTGITPHGALWTRGPAGGWRPLDSEPLGPTTAHRWAAGGVLIRLGPQGVWRHGPTGTLRWVSTPDAHGVLLTGDGGLWILGARATTALTPR